MSNFVSEVFKSIASAFTANPFNEELNTTQSHSSGITIASEGRRDADLTVVGVGGVNSYIADYTQSKTVTDRIKQYRAAANYVEVSDAIEEIVDTAVVQNKSSYSSISVAPVVQSNVSENIVKEINAVWEDLYVKLGFDESLSEYFRDWYIDGRLFAHMVDDCDSSGKADEGVFKLIRIDPINIKKVKFKELDLSKSLVFGSIVKEEKVDQTFYVYAPNTYSNFTQTGYNNYDTIAISPKVIAYSDSGLYNEVGEIVSSLEKSIIPYNTLRQMEASLAIYRTVRAPERRVFRIDTGALTGKKAEEFMDRQMAKLRTRARFDPATGKLDDSKGGMSILDDYFFPVKDGASGSSIEVLQGSQSGFLTIDDVELELKRLIKSLGVPESRLINGDQTVFSDSSEISYAEHRFLKKVNRLRSRFGTQFLSALLKRQLFLKGVMTEVEFDRLNIKWDWENDTFFEDTRKIEYYSKQITLYSSVLDLVEKGYLSLEEAVANAFNLPEADAKKLAKEIERRKKESESANQENDDE